MSALDPFICQCLHKNKLEHVNSRLSASEARVAKLEHELEDVCVELCIETEKTHKLEAQNKALLAIKDQAKAYMSVSGIKGIEFESKQRLYSLVESYDAAFPKTEVEWK